MTRFKLGDLVKLKSDLYGVNQSPQNGMFMVLYTTNYGLICCISCGSRLLPLLAHGNGFKGMKVENLYKPGDLVGMRDGCHPFVHPRAHAMMKKPFMVLGTEASVEEDAKVGLRIKVMSTIDPTMIFNMAPGHIKRWNASSEKE